MPSSAATPERASRAIAGRGLALGFLAPALLLMVLFKLWPIAAALLAGTGSYDPDGTRIGFAGLAPFADVLVDARFRHGVWLNLLAALVKVPVQLACGLAAALLLQGSTRLNAIGRAVLISPMFLGLPVTTFLFAYIFDLNVGFANALLGGIGLPRVPWLNAPLPAQCMIIALSVWRDLGLTMLVFLAGLAAIPQDLLAAAKLDGAGPLALFRTITWPLLARSVQFAVVLITLASLQLLVPVLMLTHGGPSGATDLASYQIYEAAFSFFDLGRASAMSLFVIAGLFVLIALELRWLRVNWNYA